MIRLIVGTCILVSKGDLTLEEVKEALDNQKRLPKSLSAPPQGLFLNKVEYEFITAV
jgi:tRNA pseudouridine38-40 synthase